MRGETPCFRESMRSVDALQGIVFPSDGAVSCISLGMMGRVCMEDDWLGVRIIFCLGWLCAFGIDSVHQLDPALFVEGSVGIWLC